MNAHIVIAGGGTGGHLFPGLAVADELRSRGIAVSFIGTRAGIESKIIPEHGYPLHWIEMQGLKRRGFWGTLKAIWLLPKALYQSRKHLKSLRPTAVLGVGGYASGPMVFLAAASGIPTAILEQNSVPGLTNKILSRSVQRIFTYFPDLTDSFPLNKVQNVGNPIRIELLHTKTTERPVSSKLRILILGGSQGAHAINILLPAVIAMVQTLDPKSMPTIIHQTGPADETFVQEQYRRIPGISPSNIRVVPFIRHMAEAYAETDLVIGRAGATTIAEMTALGIPSLLIPLPTATDDHQTKNAEYLQRHGACAIYRQSELTPQGIATQLIEWIQHPEQLLAMAKASKALGRPYAAKEVADWLESASTHLDIPNEPSSLAK